MISIGNDKEKALTTQEDSNARCRILGGISPLQVPGGKEERINGKKLQVEKAGTLDSFSVYSPRFEANRKLELSYGSNCWGDFIRLQESRFEGQRCSIIILIAQKSEFPASFFRALSDFIEIAKRRDKGPQMGISKASVIHSRDAGLWRKVSQGDKELLQLNGDYDKGWLLRTFAGKEVPGREDMLVSLNADQEQTHSICEDFKPEHSIGGSDINPFVLDPKTLSPLANESIPQSNSFSTLAQLDTVKVAEEDPFRHFEEKSLVFRCNALEERMSSSDEPIWYNHSDVEDAPFIVSKLRPLAINLSRCSTISMQLPKLFKQRKLFGQGSFHE
ncbi:unnamed protein product [Cuscuta campestris]|uniref:Uncharacterized protein n=1 Tax=Cuscuta campestris TaxID=132261 RepID=A0A484L6J0_9ASTE|nr:unnamed protein product [Cuscuta campestris]